MYMLPISNKSLLFKTFVPNPFPRKDLESTPKLNHVLSIT